MRDSSSTAVRVWVSAWVVESAAAETPVMDRGVQGAAGGEDRRVAEVAVLLEGGLVPAQELLVGEVLPEGCEVLVDLGVELGDLLLGGGLVRGGAREVGQYPLPHVAVGLPSR